MKATPSRPLPDEIKPGPPATSTASSWRSWKQQGLAPVADADRVTLIRRRHVRPDRACRRRRRRSTRSSAISRAGRVREGGRSAARVAAFGERWGRHWLDVARYGESTGPSRNIPYPHAWRYRDYVIDAFNRDKPYDRFIREQIAGDLLPAATAAERDRLLIATGLPRPGRRRTSTSGSRSASSWTTSTSRSTPSRRSVLGADGELRPLPRPQVRPDPDDRLLRPGRHLPQHRQLRRRAQQDGRRRAGLLRPVDARAARRGRARRPRPSRSRKLKAEVAEAKKEWDAIRGTPEGLAKGPDGRPKQQPFRLKYERLQAELLALTDPAAHGLRRPRRARAKTIGDTEIRIRGEAEKLGPIVPRGFLTAFDVPGAPASEPAAERPAGAGRSG